MFLVQYWLLLFEILETDSRYGSIQCLLSYLGSQTFSMGTGCSGTDASVFSLLSMVEAIKQKYDVLIEVAHAFSCELSREKQRWINTNFPLLQILFADIMHLGRRRANNLISGLNTLVPRCTVFVAGFSCKTASTHNSTGKRKSSYIDSESGTTGGTFDGILSYILDKMPPFAIFENVMGLIGDNLKEVVRLLSLGGYFVFVYAVNTSNYVHD